MKMAGGGLGVIGCAHCVYTLRVHTACTHCVYTPRVHTACTHCVYEDTKMVRAVIGTRKLNDVSPGT